MIGILGGTFDPVHHGHLRPALDLMQDLAFSQLRLVPCHIPPHRAPPAASAAHRLAMLQRAIVGEAGLTVDAREMQRAGPSYTVDTLASLRAELGTTPLCLIIGMDAFCRLDTWHRWSELIDFAHLLVIHRPGWKPPQHGVAARLVEQYGVDEPHTLRLRSSGGLLLWPVVQLDISSTRVRTLIAQGRSPRYLIPDAVWDYIREHNLYQSLAPSL